MLKINIGIIWACWNEKICIPRIKPNNICASIIITNINGIKL